MDPANWSLLNAWKAGGLTDDQLRQQWSGEPSALSALTTDASIDLDRRRRCGSAEVVYAPGKRTEAILEIFQVQADAGQDSLATRVTPEQAEALLLKFPEAQVNVIARTVSVVRTLRTATGGRVAVVSAGTGDRPVAEEAAETARWMGAEVEVLLDVGVAGPHRIFEQRRRFQSADAVVVVAGMEGALPSVVAGWVDVPLIAVPTSVGYGANFQGLSALLSMLNSCAANVAVVNIDAGFKAGFLAAQIARHKGRTDARPGP